MTFSHLLLLLIHINSTGILFVTNVYQFQDVYQPLLSIDTTKTVNTTGPEDIPNKLLNDFSFELQHCPEAGRH